MQIPLAYAEDIIGVGGANIAYIRRTSGAILTVQESRGLPEEITVEIKGTSSQVQAAQQLIQVDISFCLSIFTNLFQIENDALFCFNLSQPWRSLQSLEKHVAATFYITDVQES